MRQSPLLSYMDIACAGSTVTAISQVKLILRLFFKNPLLFFINPP